MKVSRLPTPRVSVPADLPPAPYLPRLMLIGALCNGRARAHRQSMMRGTELIPSRQNIQRRMLISSGWQWLPSSTDSPTSKGCVQTFGREHG